MGLFSANEQPSFFISQFLSRPLPRKDKELGLFFVCRPHSGFPPLLARRGRGMCSFFCFLNLRYRHHHRYGESSHVFSLSKNGESSHAFSLSKNGEGRVRLTALHNFQISITFRCSHSQRYHRPHSSFPHHRGGSRWGY